MPIFADVPFACGAFYRRALDRSTGQTGKCLRVVLELNSNADYVSGLASLGVASIANFVELKVAQTQVHSRPELDVLFEAIELVVEHVVVTMESTELGNALLTE